MKRAIPPQPAFMVELVDCPNENYHFLYIHAQIAANTLEEVIGLKHDAHKIMQCEDVWVWQKVDVPDPESCTRAADDGVLYPDVTEASNDGQQTGLHDDIGSVADHQSNVQPLFNDGSHRKDDPVA